MEKRNIQNNSTMHPYRHVLTNRTPWYPSAIYLRDENGGSFVQAQLARRENNLVNDGLFFLRLSDDEIAEADPATKQIHYS